MLEKQIDCIVRLHNPERLLELGRCIFSLVGQTYRPLHVILAVQRFSKSDLESVRHTLAPVLSLPEAPTLEIINWQQPEPRDARTELLNFGLSVCRGQYLGFLDYDDTLYPEAYQLLVNRLAATQAAIAFASVRVMNADVYRQFIHVRSQVTEPPFRGANLRDLFQANFCPIHSYLMDRSKIGTGGLKFDTNLTREEDYDMLLQVCSAHLSDFGMLGKVIGDYYYKADGSNSVPHAWQPLGRLSPEYEHVPAMIEARRRTTAVAPPVQQALGLAQYKPGLTIRDVLDRH